MVKDGGQLYTIEGFAAGLIMILTAYLVVNATSVYTPGDTHISDMQLEVLGNDALNIMDVSPDHTVDKTALQTIIENDQAETFKTMFLNMTNNRTEMEPDRIWFVANYSCRNSADNSVQSYPLSTSRALAGGEHAVRVTKWVIVNKNVCGASLIPPQDRSVLVEVLMWRD